MTGPSVVRLGIFSPPVLVRVARTCGHLADLDVVEVPATDSPAQFRDLAAGRLDAALTSPDNVLRYRFRPDNPLGRTLDVRLVLGVDRGLGLALFGRAGARDLADLRGGRLGVDVAGSGFAYAGYELLARAGWTSPADYTVVELGSTPRRLQALLAGQCDLTLLNAGNDLRAEAAGLPRLGRVADVVTPYLGTVLAATGQTCDRRDPGVRALARGLRATMADLHAGRHRAATVEAAADALGLPATLAQRYLDTLLDPREGLVDGGRLDPADLAAVARLRHRHDPGPPGTRRDEDRERPEDHELPEDPDLVDRALLADG